MARNIVSCFALIICVTNFPAYAEYNSDTRVHLPLKEKVTNLRFFLQDTISGKNPTAVRVAKANRTIGGRSPTPFGSVYAIDDPLRVGIDPRSQIIGNAQGLYFSSSQDSNKLTIVMCIDLAFTTGKFNGSSISVFSRNPVFEAEREVAVVGGRGEFRLARGFVKLKTIYFNDTNGDAIIEYNVTVLHY